MSNDARGFDLADQGDDLVSLRAMVMASKIVHFGSCDQLEKQMCLPVKKKTS